MYYIHNIQHVLSKKKVDLENIGTCWFWQAGQATECPKCKPGLGQTWDMMV